MKRNPLLLIALSLALIPAVAHARTPAPIQPTLIATDELVARLLKFRQDHPDDAEAFYRLGRAHYVAARLGLGKIAVEDWSHNAPNATDLGALHILIDRFEAGRPTRDPWPPGRVADPQPPQPGVEHQPVAWLGGVDLKPLPDNFFWSHLNYAIPNFREAIRLDPKNPRYHLALAVALEDYSHDEHIEGMLEDTPSLSAADALTEAAVEYITAFNIAMKTEGDLRSRPYYGVRSLISYEAAKSCVPLLEKAKPLNNDAAAQWPAVKKQMNLFIDFFDKLPEVQTKRS